MSEPKEASVTIFLDGFIRRPADAPRKKTAVPFAEPQTSLPTEARERLKAMDDTRLEDIIEWFDGSPHFADIVTYARAILRSHVPLEDRIVCSRCSALYEAWTKDDPQWGDGVELVDGWVEAEYRTGNGRNFDDTDWKALCPRCPPTPEEVAEWQACRQYTEDFIASRRRDANE
jgi:hypothetical protein